LIIYLSFAKILKQNSMEQHPLDTPENTKKLEENKSKLWLKRLGIGGFLFFLGKGILWLLLGKAALSALCN
jgi:hypothetical protein